MSSTMTTPILFPGPFYLPVILPPDRFFTLPTSYYKDLKDNKGVTVTASSPNPTAPLEITVGNADVEQERKNGEKLAVANVYAATAGFITLQQSNVVLRLWPGHFKNLVKSPIGQRPNRIVYGSLDAPSIQAAVSKHIAALPKIVLQESWTQTNSGIPPEDEETLKAALLVRFMTGDASIYVDAGAPIGTGTRNGDDATLTLQTFFDPADPLLPTIPIPAEDLIDNAQELGRLRLFGGHPLVKAISDLDVTVNFSSQFLIWNNTTFSYEPFIGKPVTLLVTPPLPLLPEDLIPKLPVGGPQLTNQAGGINITVNLPSRATIRFRYGTANLTYGNRTFDTDIETDPHKARSYVDANSTNAHQYKAKFEVYPGYQAFIDDIAERGKWETVEKDRGNANEYDKSKPEDLISASVAALAVLLPDKLEPRIAFDQHELQSQIASLEAFYKLDVIPSKTTTFNFLVEGDSWTNYALAFNDLYSHLDAIFQRKLKPGMSYNRVPLQHFGDGSLQMFVTGLSGKRQWDFTMDFLREYRIDLILCSAGGNDFAEPGISNSFDVEPYDQYFTDGYFDPYLAKTALTADQLAQAVSLMERSFAVMLNNHRWNFFVRNLTLANQKDEATLRAALDPLVNSIGTEYTPERIAELKAIVNQIGSGLNLQAITDPVIRFAVDTAVDLTKDAVWEIVFRTIIQDIGTKVIANFPDDPLSGGNADQLLKTVFDTRSTNDGYFDRRYAAVEANWRILLNAAKQLGIPVISHTYGYPLFKETPASLLGLGRAAITGPWFTHRFSEARLIDRRVQKCCLKAFLDQFERAVFSKFKTQYQFDYVDSRNFNSDVDLWRDELHLHSTGYKKIAEAVFAKAQQWSGVAQFFEA